MTLLPLNYIRVAHNYSGTNWQNFTGDLSTAAIVLREFSGTHTAALTFYRANMDPSQSSATTVVKKGDKVRIHMQNKSGVWRRTATMKIKNVAVDIDLSKPAGRQNKVTINLVGTGVAGVAGTGASKGVATVPELSDVITGAPFEINGNGYALTTSAWTGTAHLSTSTETDIDGGPARTNLSTNPSLETSTAGYAAGANNTIAQDAAWAAVGTKSLKITPTGASNDTYAEFNIATTIGQTYTVSATVHLTAAQTGTLNSRARALYCLTTATLSTAAPNAAGDTRVSLTFTASATTSVVRLYNGSTNVGEPLWWDAILAENTTTAGTGLGYFDGASNAAAGTTTALGTSVEIAAINEASVYDQVILTRDSNPGTIGYEDPAGRVQLYDPATYRTAAPALTIGPAQYSQIDQEFDMSHIINVVTFKYFERVHPARRPSRMVEHDITYQDAASVAKYGPFRKVIKTHKKSNFATHASNIFTRNADPAAVPKSVLVPIRQVSELLPGYEDGHYVGEKVKVTLPDNVTTYTCRISKIAHAITPTTWAVQVFLREQNLIQPPRHHTKVSSEVANTPDGLVLTAHLDDAAVTSAKTAYPVVGGIGTVAPATPKADDLWIDTTAGANILKRWNAGTSAWVSAQDAAIATAQSTANGKNKVTYSTSDPIPGTTPNTAGDLWWTYTGTIVSKQWQGNGGTSWTQVTVGNTVIANLDAGKVTTGFLAAARIQAQSLGADKLVVGDSTNIVVDSSADNLGTWAGLSGPWSVATPTLASPTDRNSKVFRYTAGNAYAQLQEALFPVTPGDVYTVANYHRLVGAAAGAGNVGLFLFFADSTGTFIGTGTPVAGGPVSTDTAIGSVPAAWTRVSVSVAVPTGAAFAQPVLRATAGITGGQYEYDQLFVGRQITGQLLVNGAIDGKVITGPVIQTKSGLGGAGVSGMKMEDDTAGGVVKFWTGAAAETAGSLNPNLVAGQPSVRLTGPSTTTYVRVPYLDLAAGTSNSRVELKGDLTNILGALAVTGSLKVGAPTTPIRGLDFAVTSVTTNATGDVTVSHALGVTPTTVLFTSHTGTFLAFRITGLTATTYTIRVWNIQTGAVHASATFSLGWAAIG